MLGWAFERRGEGLEPFRAIYPAELLVLRKGITTSKGDDPYASLRLALSLPPSSSCFQMLLDGFLSGLWDSILEEALVYAASHLASWCDELRAASLERLWPDPDTMAAPHPCIRLVRTLTIAPRWHFALDKGLLHSPTLTHLTGLRWMGEWMSNELLGLILASPLLRGLKWLDLSESPSSRQAGHERDQMPHMLSQSANLSNLEKLDLGGLQLDHSSLSVLAQSESLPQLRVLGFSGSSLQGGEESLGMFATSTLASRLVSLDLSGSQLSAPLLRACFVGADWRHLETLCLSQNPLGQEGCEVLSEAKLPALRELHLRRTGITSEGLSVLAAWPSLSGLGSLSLAFNPIEQKGLEGLAQASCKELRSLDLSYTIEAALNEEESPFSVFVAGVSRGALGPDAAAWITAHFPHLESLSLDGNPIGDAGVRELAEGPLGALRVLSLINCRLTDEAAFVIASTAAWPELVHLGLSAQELSEDGFAALVCSPSLPLSVRWMMVAPLSQARVEQVAQHLGLALSKGASDPKEELLGLLRA